MVFDPFSSPSAEFFSQRKFSDQLADQGDAAAGLVGSAVSNKYHVEAVRRTSEHQLRLQDLAQKFADGQADRADTRGLITTGVGTVATIAASLV